MKRRLFALLLGCLTLAALSGCVMDPVTGLVCPPGTHPGRYGHHCWAN
jgi:hypothetical protein